MGRSPVIEGVKIFRVWNPFRIKNIPVGPSFKKMFFDLLILFKGLKLIHKNHFSVIHGIEDAGIIALVLARISWTKVIYEKHSDAFSYKRTWLLNQFLSLYSVLERVVVKHSDGVICTGPAMTEQVLKLNTNNRVFDIFDLPSVIADANPDEVEKSRSELQQGREEVVLTFVGSFASYQGVDLLMDAILITLKSMSTVRFVIIGEHKLKIDAWKHCFQKNGVIDKVTFLGLLSPEQISVVLSASDILISPRVRGANSPLKLLDYMKSGKCIIATNIPANKQILKAETALFVNPDPHSLAAGIKDMVMKERKREILGQNARRHYASNYSYNDFKNRLTNCYDLIISE